jgi:hypothetical protein
MELTTKDVIAELTVTAGLSSQIVEHAVWGYIIRVHLSHIHESLLLSEQLALVELNHVRKFTLFLAQLCILLLLFPEL